MVVNVCVGSSCHLKGSYEVIQRLEKIVEEEKLQDRVTIKASFCLGNCSKGVSIKIDDELIGNVTPDNIGDILKERIEK